MGEGYNVKLGDLEWDFVPVYGDGKITAHLRQLTVEECESCLTMSVSQPLDRAKMITLGLEGLDDFSVDGKAIKTAADILSAPQGVLPLYTELFIAIRNGNTVTEDESKNS